MDRDQISEHLKFAASLGIAGVSRDPAWRNSSGRRAPAPLAAVPEVAGTPIATVFANQAEALAAIRADIGDCTRCKLHTGRHHIVFGVGNPHAELMFVGEAPGADEDMKGEPFGGGGG